MEVRLERYLGGDYDTLGRLYIDGKFECFTLEDDYDEFKTKGETRIPAGRYRILFRTEGTHHINYSKTYGTDFHKGMLHLQDVPNYQYILIHIGNTRHDTEGCILVGKVAWVGGMHKLNRVDQSKVAYKAMYPKIRDALLRGEDVWITIEDEKK